MKITAIAAAACAMFAGVASADPAETKGGLSIKTDDGRFEAKLGGRIHFDYNGVDEDGGAYNNSPAGSSAANPANSGFFFRRIYMTLSGKLYGWKYKIEPDFAPNNSQGATSIAFQDVLMMTDLGPGEIQIGQRKPFRAMEDLTSSNDVLMIERPFASSSGGMFKGGTGASSTVAAAPGSVTNTFATNDREFQDGLFYHGNGDQYTWGVSFTSLRRDNTAGTEGIAESVRGTYAPLNAEGSILHLGLSYSAEQPGNNQSASPSSTAAAIGAGGFAYAGRRGPSFNLGSTTGDVGTIGAEVAGAFGPFFFQGEYMTQKQDDINAAGNNQTVDAYYIQGSWLVTGETKPYKKADGVFGSAKPINSWGAVELTARYDAAQNKDFVLGGATTAGTSCTKAGADKCEISAITIGTNYYANPNVRFMLNYILGEANQGAAGKDKPKTIAARAQLSF